MSQSLFTTQTPNTTNNSDGGAAGITVATGILFLVAGTVSAIRFWATDTTTGTWTVELWQATTGDNVGATGTKLASKVASGVVAGWNTVTLDTPVSVDTTHYYRAAVNNSQGRYVHRASVFASSGITNGNLSAPVDGADPVGIGTMRNSAFALNSPANTYPHSNASAAAFYVDVLFDAGTPVDVTLTPAAVTVAAVPLTATPGPVGVTLTPAALTLTAVALGNPCTVTRPAAAAVARPSAGAVARPFTGAVSRPGCGS